MQVQSLTCFDYAQRIHTSALTTGYSPSISLPGPQIDVITLYLDDTAYSADEDVKAVYFELFKEKCEGRPLRIFIKDIESIAQANDGYNEIHLNNFWKIGYCRIFRNTNDSFATAYIMSSRSDRSIFYDCLHELFKNLRQYAPEYIFIVDAKDMSKRAGLHYLATEADVVYSFLNL